MKYFALIALLGASATRLNMATPDESRAIFEEHRAEAAKVVATQEAFEANKVADVAARNNSNWAEADALKQHVRAAANANMMGRTPANPKKQLWTGPEMVQLKEEPAAEAQAAPAAPATPAPEAPPADAAAPSTAAEPAPEITDPKPPQAAPAPPKKGSIQYTYQEKANAVADAATTVSNQMGEEAAWLKEHAEQTAKIASETEAAKNAVRKEKNLQAVGGVDMPPAAPKWTDPYMAPSAM